MEVADGSSLAEIALEVLGAGAWEVDLSTDCWRRTPGHDRIFGYTGLQAAWSRRQLLDHVHPQHRSLVISAFGRALTSGKLRFACEILTANGQARSIVMYGRILFAEDGQPALMTGCVFDVTRV